MLKFEREAEEKEWEEQWANVLTVMDLPDDTPAPPCPRADYITLSPLSAAVTDSDPSIEADAATGDKRKASDLEEEDAGGKKTKGAVEGTGAGHRILTVLRSQDMKGPKLPTRAEAEAAILKRQKADLLKEYIA